MPAKRGAKRGTGKGNESAGVREAAKPGLRRLTSSGKHPIKDVPLPERLAKVVQNDAEAYGRSLGGVDPTNKWTSRVRKVESCDLGEYDNGKGLVTRFDSSQQDAGREQCFIRCEGTVGPQGLLITIEKNGDTLKSFNPKDRRMSIRLYDVDVSLELRDDSEDEQELSECWVIKLATDLHPEHVMVASKRMLRRIESVTSRMPADWFTYRNYDSYRDDGKGAQTIDKALVFDFPGSHQWRFTKHLNTPFFASALVEGNADPDEAAAMPSLPKTAKGKKRQKDLLKKIRRRKNVRARLDPEAEEAAAEEHAQEIIDEQRYDIDGLLDTKIEGNKPWYLVKWSGKWPPSWEPEENIDQESIEDYERDGACPPAPTSSSSPSPAAKGKQATKGRKGRPTLSKPGKRHRGKNGPSRDPTQASGSEEEVETVVKRRGRPPKAINKPVSKPSKKASGKTAGRKPVTRSSAKEK